MPASLLADCRVRLAAAVLATLVAAAPAAAASGSWGAIAAHQDAYGWAYDFATRDKAEQAARQRCERAGAGAGQCQVRIAFENGCGALAVGNFTEWGSGYAPNAKVAQDTALQQCNRHLPTEPCKVKVAICSVKKSRP